MTIQCVVQNRSLKLPSIPDGSVLSKRIIAFLSVAVKELVSSYLLVLFNRQSVTIGKSTPSMNQYIQPNL